MNGLNVLVLSLSRLEKSEAAGIFESFGHEVSDLSRLASDDHATGDDWDVVVVDTATTAVDRRDISRIRSRFSLPVLVVGERPMCLSGIDGAMFCFSDASEHGYELALRMCLALSPLVSCESTSQTRNLASQDSLGSLLSPDRWLERPRSGETAHGRTVPA